MNVVKLRVNLRFRAETTCRIAEAFLHLGLALFAPSLLLPFVVGAVLDVPPRDLRGCMIDPAIHRFTVFWGYTRNGASNVASSLDYRNGNGVSQTLKRRDPQAGK